MASNTLAIGQHYFTIDSLYVVLLAVSSENQKLCDTE